MNLKSKKDLRIPFAWEERRPAFLDRFFYLPKQFDHEKMWLKFSDPMIFGNDRPVHLELCSGNGQWIGEQALSNPEINWVAVEMRFDRARKIWLKIFREKIPNLYVVCAEGASFLRHYVEPASIRESFVNFPDPWPKRCHGKHRLIWAPFLELLGQAVGEGGRATMLTDDAAYRDQMIREFAKLNRWQPEFPAPFYRTEWNSYGSSFFGDLWKEKGRESFYIKYINENKNH
jgi:tRNA (guanine-N7-)-methyltransferase